MFLAHPFIAGGAVLQIVPAAPGFHIAPFGGHLRRCDGKVVFGPQIGSVIGVVYLAHVMREGIVTLYPAFVVPERQADFAQFVVYLESGKHEGVMVKLAHHRRRDVVVGDTGVDGVLIDGVRGLDEIDDLLPVQQIGVVAFLFEHRFGGLQKVFKRYFRPTPGLFAAIVRQCGFPAVKVLEGGVQAVIIGCLYGGGRPENFPMVNLFVKPNEQSRTCSSYAVARKGA